MQVLQTFANETVGVEVFVLDPKSLPLDGFATVLTGDGPPRSTSTVLGLLLLLLQRAVDSLLLKNCSKQKQKAALTVRAVL